MEKTLAALHPTPQQDNSTGVMASELAKRPCFRHGKFKHIKRFCSEDAENARAPNRCSRCRKGRHFANHCHSRMDVDRRPLLLLGNSKKSMAFQNTATQVVAMTHQHRTPQDTQYVGNSNLTPYTGPSTASPVTQNCCHQRHSANWHLPNQHTS